MLIKAIVGLFNLLIKALGAIVNVVLMILPPSPFLFLESFELPFLDTLNWVIPVSFFVNVLGYWIGAIAVYYTVQVVLRWAKMIQ